MKQALTAGAALLLTTSLAHAVGLDRSGQPIGIIFEEGGETGAYAEFSFGYVMPEVDGEDVAAFGGSETGNVAEDYSVLGFGYKRDINDQFSIAVIVDEPYGADIVYPTGDSVALGGTEAILDSVAVTGLLRYKIDDNISVYGGLRAQSIEGSVTLDGLAYGGPPPGGVSGYNVDLDRDTGFGYTLGAAYEIPDIALRVALTYISEIEHEFGTTDTFGSTEDTEVTTPQAVNLDFQTGIAADTLLFGSVRWAEYSVVIVEPENFPLGSLTDIEDGFGYTLGIGRRFTDEFSGSVSIGFEPEGDSDLVSPLSPTNGNFSIGVAGEYEVDNVTLAAGVRYIMPGDASAETGTPDTARSDFEDNSAIGVGFKIGYNF
ncbi:OmpP1/FadL family transporter [Cognatiyoonia sp. IB215182]|uniref:OmpP1/FadL family transporter n=1 Tax=Cognatiyoonia sp. IB215182 TaxID=3097353 RepID=UPI002A161848|nr:outer membrane protein transport protein [Cognatiyoonia sp. IB215182]MDX8352023.1 outer membrane protein transport protein [Cognatiyoonia sp. IB215182]